MMKNNISNSAKFKVEWLDTSENYSRENKIKVRNYFSNKYGVTKNNINVVFKPIKVSANGDLIEISGAGIENIMDVNYQRELMKELIKREAKVVDFNRILALDDKVNGELDVDLSVTQHRSWSIKWLMIDNFLSFGENNYMPFSKLNGLTIVNSIPENQGGKTTLTIDAIKFLLHGTTTKTDTNEQIFNTFSDKNELVVRGMLDIEGDEILIERKMRRSAKKGGGWTVTNKINYYEIMPDGEEKALNEEDAKQTTKKIKESIGSEKDFEMLVLATEKNLEDLIGLSTTESGKILTRLIGLEVLEMKEGIARGMYNEFSKKKKSNLYDVITLGVEIDDHNEKLVLCDELKISLEEKLETTKNEIVNLTNEKEKYINSKEKIDIEISALNPSKLEEDIELLIKKGVELNNNLISFRTQIKDIGEVIFDEDNYHSLTKVFNLKTTEKALKEAEVTRLGKVIADLISGGICKGCNRKLDDVDNTEHIENHETEIRNIKKELEEIETILLETNNQLVIMGKDKTLIDSKNKLELNADRLEVEIESLRNRIGEKRNDLKKYKLNLEGIEFNRKVDIEVINIKTKIDVCNYSRDTAMGNLERVKNDIESHKNNIITKTKLIETIKKEEEVDKIFKTYIELVGKKGISKLVLRSVLPIINSEVQRLLEDVCDFEVEIYIDEKNNVQFLLNKDGISKQLKSGSGLEKTAASLALRCVLGKISTLPMPNFITFDEILGKVAPVNLEKLKILFDKMKDMYEIVFFITHNDIVKDWADSLITVVKKDNLSKISIK